MSTFPRLRREKEKSKVFTASINVQNIESLPRCDLYFSDPDAKAKEARMSYAISGGEIKPSFSQQYSASYQDCISADKRSIRSQLLFLDDKDDAFRTNDDNEGHVEEKTHIVASKKSSENSQSHSAGNTHCHIHHETANEQASTNGETMEYSKYDENVKTTSGRGDTRKTPPPLRTLELSEAECTVESLPRTPFISEENDDSLSLEVPSKSQLHTDIYEEMHEEQGDSVTQITNRPKIRLLPNGRLVGLAPALSGKSQNTFDHSPSRRTQIEPLGPIRRLRRSLSRSRRKTESLTSDDAQSASSNKAIGSRIRSTRRKVTKKPKTDDTIASKSRFFRFASNRRALVSRYACNFLQILFSKTD